MTDAITALDGAGAVIRGVDTITPAGAVRQRLSDASTRLSAVEVVEAAVEEIGMRLTGPRAAHQREGHKRFTLDRILAEEVGVMDLVDARDPRVQLWIKDEDAAGLSVDQQRAVQNIAASPWLVCPVSAPAGAGKTTSMRALTAAAPPLPPERDCGGADLQGGRRGGAQRRRRHRLYRGQSLAIVT